MTLLIDKHINMKKFLMFFVVSVLLSLSIQAQEKPHDNDRELFIDFVISTFNDDFAYRHVAFKIRAYNSDEVYIFSKMLIGLFDTYKNRKSWNKEQFFEYFTPIIFHDEILIVEEDMMDVYFKYPNIKYKDCKHLYNWEKEKFEYILSNNEVGVRFEFNDCFIYKCLKRNVLPISIMVEEGMFFSNDIPRSNDLSFLTRKTVHLDMELELIESPEEYEKFIRFVLENPTSTAWEQLIAFKIQSYKSDETYVFMSDLNEIYRQFRQVKKWDEKLFKDTFFNVLFNDEVYIVEHDMEDYFFSKNNRLLKDCDVYYNFDNQKEFHDLILISDYKTNPIPHLDCFIYKGLKKYSLLVLNNSYYLILGYPFSE